MGRGRAKAKQTKVARQLKYYTPDTDLSALERELHKASETDRKDTSRFDEDNYDDYGKWAAGEP
ncbi:MAG TPA: DUF3073 domain-containing protein [Intrasporangium sp.]|jgi:hypothetical protein|nr:DUF3073 domain-containing protein [Intrasporangium sp.]